MLDRRSILRKTITNHCSVQGARVDVRSAEYSYSFDKSLEQEWTWKEVYAPQPELLTYVHHVLDRYDLRRSIDFNARVKSCVWDDAKMVWKVTVLHHAEMERSIDDILGTAEPEAHEESVQARFLIFATGCLSAPNLPKWPGFETSSAKIYHTARWPTQGVDFTGLKVAIIGTGSSSVQTISTIAPECAELTVFQRTATYSIPAHNRKLTPEEVEKDKAQYEGLRKRQQEKTGCIDWVVPTRSVDEFTEEEIEEELERRWQTGGLTFGAAFKDGMTNPKANEKLKLFIHKKIRSIVKDPVTAELLCPDQVVSCKRLCIDTGYVGF